MTGPTTPTPTPLASPSPRERVRLFRGLRKRRSFKHKADEWDQSIDAEPTPKPQPESVKFVIGVLERQLERANTIIKHADDKAVVIIPAVGVVAGLTGDSALVSFEGKSWVVVGTGVGAAIAAVVAVACALISLLPRSRSNGPLAIRVVRGVSSEVQDARWHYVRSLGFAVQTAEEEAVKKGGWINRAFRTSAVGVLLLATFIGTGGLAT